MPHHHRVLLLLTALAALANGPAAAAQCGVEGDCLQPHPSPGCEDSSCCQTVCSSDPLCCLEDWDAGCVKLANQLCVGLCGAAASGDCAVIHGTPSCDDRDCCEAVCKADPTCCDEEWDFTCVLLASLTCTADQPGVCGDPTAGPCTEPHSEPACDDEACCSFVCGIEPSCCEQSWSMVCAALAEQYCLDACEPSCPTGAVAETEDCGQDFNNPCYLVPSPFPSIQSVPCGTWACGQLTSTPGGFRDVDVWSVTVTDPDGDGQTAVRLSLASSFAGFAALVPAPCGPLPAAVTSIETGFCVELAGEVTCVPPGQYRIVVAAGTYPNPGNPSLPCGQFGSTRYRIRLECLPGACGSGCGPGAGSCFEPRKRAGCNDVACCDIVCAVDPSCCEVQWDTSCVDAAQPACADPPANDECESAVELVGETVEISTIGATASVPPFPASCGGVDAGADVWIRTVAPRTGTCTVSTCGSAGIDSVVSIHTACGGQPVVCNDNGLTCIPKTSSRLVFPATCGATYLIRVGSVGGTPGNALVRVEYGPGPECGCPADRDGDGSVGGADLTIILSSWNGPAGDLDGDGTTGGADLTLLLSAWGPCP